VTNQQFAQCSAHLGDGATVDREDQATGGGNVAWEPGRTSLRPVRLSRARPRSRIGIWRVANRRLNGVPAFLSRPRGRRRSRPRVASRVASQGSTAKTQSYC
jgi:hypothetical protein